MVDTDGLTAAEQREVRDRKASRKQSAAIYLLAGYLVILAIAALAMGVFTNELFGPVAAEFPSSVADTQPGDENLIVPDVFVVRIERLDHMILRLAWNSLAALKYVALAGIVGCGAKVTGRLADESPFSDRNLVTMRMMQLWFIPLMVSLLGSMFLDGPIASSVGLEAAGSTSLLFDNPGSIAVVVLMAAGLFARANALQRQADETF